MAYQSLYRKYRPQTFADVVGQGHVVRTLQNALQSGRIAHGFLFTGTRGTAKTTVARLLAKCLNCESTSHAVPEPCNQCDACRAIASGTCIDVVEMDAASHRGVADIEEVRKAVGYGPMQYRTKVFIIDEAHQLSSDAKDAFLKTLEEPPPGVVFILATTEPQSIPITIRSRCQQFDFKRGSLSEIAGRLLTVAQAEGVEIAPDAVHRIARAAEGSYRDSLSLLEQVLAFCDRTVTSAEVDTVLGALGADHLERLVRAMAEHDCAVALELAADFTDSGKEVRTVLRAVASHLRDLLLLRAGADPSSIGISPDDQGLLKQTAGQFSTEQLLAAIDTVNGALSDLRWNNQHRLLLEIAFVKLTTRSVGPQPHAVSPGQIEVSRGNTTIAAPRPTTSQSAQSKPIPESAPPAAPPPPPQPMVAPTTRESYPARIDEESETEEVDAGPDQEGPGLFDAPESIPARTPEPSVASVTETPSLSAPSVSASPLTASSLIPEPDVPASAEFGLDDVLRVWPVFLDEAGKYSKQAQVFLTAARPTTVDSGVVVINFSNRANCEMMQQQKQQEFIRRMLGRSLGAPNGSVPVRLVVDDAMQPAARQTRTSKPRHNALAALDALELTPETTERPAAQPSAAPPAPKSVAPPPPPAVPEPAAENVADNPLVQDILSTFGGTIIDS
jgi:DNA polymerase-3 subunit gamma/tau